MLQALLFNGLPSVLAFRLCFGGDTLLGGNSRAQTKIDTFGYAYPLEQVRSLIEQADYAIGNLQGPITNRADFWDPDQKFPYSALPPSAPALSRVGFDAMGLSNSNIMDRGPAGLTDTLTGLTQNNVTWFGAGTTDDALEPLLVRTSYGTVAVVALGSNWGHIRTSTLTQVGTVEYTEGNIQRGIELARARGAVRVVAFVHWGFVYKTAPNSEQTRVAAQLACAGYDLVIGHHPKVLQGVSYYGSMPVIWSLGNLYFGVAGSFTSAAQGYGLLATARLGPDGFENIELVCLVTDNTKTDYQTRVCDQETARLQLEGLSPSGQVNYHINNNTATMTVPYEPNRNASKTQAFCIPAEAKRPLPGWAVALIVLGLLLPVVWMCLPRPACCYQGGQCIDWGKISFASNNTKKKGVKDGKYALVDGAGGLSDKEHPERPENFTPELRALKKKVATMDPTDHRAIMWERFAVVGSAPDARPFVWGQHLKYVHQVFKRRAEAFPDKVALEWWEVPEKVGWQKTYKELDDWSDQIATYIKLLLAEQDQGRNNAFHTPGSAARRLTRIHTPHTPHQAPTQGDFSTPSTTKRELKDNGPNASNPAGDGIEPEVVVCIYLEKGFNLLAAMIGAFKAEVAVAVVDDHLPLQRLYFIETDSKARVLITLPRQIEGYEQVAREEGAKLGHPADLKLATLLNIEEFASKGHVEQGELAALTPRPPLHDKRLMALIYTSGSTGNPKGVEIQYDAFCNYAAVEQLYTAPTPDDRILQTQSFSFIAGFHEVWRCLLGGATCVQVSQELTRMGPGLVKWMEKAEITFFKAVPSMLRTIMIGKPPMLPKLRVLHVGGEAVTQDLVEFFQANPNRWFFNTYGPTECTANCASWPCKKGDKFVAVGPALPTYRCHILNDEFKEVKQGETGRMWVSGIGVNRGYKNLPNKTKEVFKEVEGFGRIYDTGDLIEKTELSEGYPCLRYAGRSDSQVKVNGYRVELGEVENALHQIPGMADCCTLFINERIIGFGEHQDPPDKQLLKWKLKDIREHMEKSGLPYFALPSQVEMLPPGEKLPKNTSGKMDRPRIQREYLEKLAKMA
eukprot:g12709.t1